MFNEITIKQSNNLLFDLGQIAESLLFYKKVNLVCNPSFFKYLIDYDETDSFFELIALGQINVKIEDNIFASMRNVIGEDKILWYKPVLVQGKNVSLKDRLEKVIYDTTKRSGFSKRLTKKILNNSNVLLHSDVVLEYVKQDLRDEVYLKRAFSHSLQDFDPKVIVQPENIEVKINQHDKGILINSNINFSKINELNDNGKTINEESILLKMMNTRIDSTLASKTNSDLITSPLTTILIKEKVNHIISKTSKNLDQIDNFSNVFLHDGKKIRNVLNSRERSLKEYIKILEKADKFKHWLNNIEDDKNLLSEYNKAVTSETWVDKLPGKSFRWTFFTGVGLTIDMLGAGGIGTAIGTAISAGDTFILDKLIKGWKPNTFVNNELDDFIKQK